MITHEPKFFLAAENYLAGDICGNCGHSYVEKTSQYFTCPEKKCRCSCQHDHNAECLVHWRCGCTANSLCNYHTERPDLIVLRYTCRKSADARLFRQALRPLMPKARLLVARQNRAREKAWTSRCGNCFAKMQAQTGSKKPVCLNGCKCLCNRSTANCNMHFDCTCKLGEYPCIYHISERPDIISWVWSQLPKPESDFLLKQFKAASFAPENYLGGKAKSRSQKPIQSTTMRQQADKRTELPFETYRSDYLVWLSKQRLSEHSKRNYGSRIAAFSKFLCEHGAEDLTSANRDEVTRDFKKHLKQTVKIKPASLNSYLAAMNNFFGFLAIGSTSVAPEPIANEAPKALSKPEQKRLLKTVDRCRRIKDKAIMYTFLYTGIRISELQKLELDDVFVVGRNCRLIVRSGKGDRYREIPLNSELVKVLQAWLVVRKEKYGKSKSPAFFVNAQGIKMGTGAIDKIVRKVGLDCGLELCAHKLRHTLLTNLLRKQKDVVLVADVAGHRNLKTTQRYTLPSAADKAEALESLLDG